MPNKQKTLLPLRIFFAAALSFSFAGCQSIGGPVPSVDIKLYAGDSAHGGVTRNNPGGPIDTIKGTDPRIDAGYWMLRTDFNKAISTYIDSCEQWKTGAVFIAPVTLWNKVRP